MDNLSGDERLNQGDDWFDEFVTLTELASPGSARVVKWVLETSEKLTVADLDKPSNPALAISLEEKYTDSSSKKTLGRSRSNVEHNDVHNGLEAFRAITWNLSKTDSKRTKEHFDTLTELPAMQESEFRLFPTMLTTWEAELKTF